MRLNGQPLVSVVTPVYNGEATIAECIESVLAQSYHNFEYIIVDNCSTDDTGAIIKRFAERDERVVVYKNAEFLAALQNQNFAMTLISEQSRYCKVVHADDWLYPECIAVMTALADSNPSVGIVGSFMLHGEFVFCDGLGPPRGGEGQQYPSRVFPGREICQIDLNRTGRPSVLGNPSTILLRSSLIRERQAPFYDERHLFMDRDACYRILQEHDFGFIYQVLSFMRKHEGQLHSHMHRVSGFGAARLYLLTTYGPSCLERSEYEALRSTVISQYRGFLRRQSLLRIGFRKHKAFWDYHFYYLGLAGFPISQRRVWGYALEEALLLLLSPGEALKKAWNALGRWRASRSARRHVNT